MHRMRVHVKSTLRSSKHYIALFLAHLKMMLLHVDEDIITHKWVLDEGTEAEEDSLRE